MGGTDGVGLGVDKTTGKPNIDESAPKTRIRIRFHNGEQEVVDFNLSHTVGDIHTYVMQAAPVDGSYQLVEGFPPKSLDTPDITIEEAGLKGASIQQKIL